MKFVVNRSAIKDSDGNTLGSKVEIDQLETNDKCICCFYGDNHFEMSVSFASAMQMARFMLATEK